MPNYLGTATGNTGIPSLLLSSLQQVTDKNVYNALYQIQNWANSFYPLLRLAASTGALVGNPGTNPIYTVQGGIVGITATAANFSFSYEEPFPNGVLTLLMQPVSAGTSDNVTILRASCTNAVAAGQYWRSGAALTGASAIDLLVVGF